MASFATKIESSQRVREDDDRPAAQVPPSVAELIRAGVLCNDATVEERDGQWQARGDPTEGALLSLAGKAGLEKDQQSSWFPRAAEFPFSSERKRMSVMVAGKEQNNGHGLSLTPYPLPLTPYP